MRQATHAGLQARADVERGRVPEHDVAIVVTRGDERSIDGDRGAVERLVQWLGLHGRRDAYPTWGGRLACHVRFDACQSQSVLALVLYHADERQSIRGERNGDGSAQLR